MNLPFIAPPAKLKANKRDEHHSNSSQLGSRERASRKAVMGVVKNLTSDKAPFINLRCLCTFCISCISPPESFTWHRWVGGGLCRHPSLFWWLQGSSKGQTCWRTTQSVLPAKPKPTRLSLLIKGEQIWETPDRKMLECFPKGKRNKFVNTPQLIKFRLWHSIILCNDSIIWKLLSGVL